MVSLLTIAVVAVTIVGVNAAVDKTLSPEAAGSVVVDAVVDRIRSSCVYGEDHLFLRRLAYVETNYGEDPQTYRTGYHGGIWQIDEGRFDYIDCGRSWMKVYCDMVYDSFGIDWPQVRWIELRKPLYSGLAASLYVHSILYYTPVELLYQAYIWAWYFRADGDMNYFTTKSRNLPENDCSANIDLAFLVDGSRSIGSTDFKHMLSFVQNLTKEFSVDDGRVQVSALEYSDDIGTCITFNGYSDKNDLLSQIADMSKGDRGTNTHKALDSMRTVLFTSAQGARSGVKRVGVEFSDAHTLYPIKTRIAADKAKDQGITLISVGVAGANRTYLEDRASQPSCTHVYNTNFNEMDSLLYYLKQSICAAPTALPSADENTDTVRAIPEGCAVKETFVAQVPTGSGPTTNDLYPAVRIEVTPCGRVEVYGSYSTTRPNAAFNDVHDTATQGNPAILYLDNAQGRPLYITVVANRRAPSDDATSCADVSYNIIAANVERQPEVVCQIGQQIRACSLEDLKDSPFQDFICDDFSIDNPCTIGRIDKHEYPGDLTRFIQCDVRGKMYVTRCPEAEVFDIDAGTCGSASVGSPGPNAEPLPAGVANPCTSENAANNLFYFPFPLDNAKFIQCDVFNNAWVIPCETDLIWSVEKGTCVVPTPASRCNDDNNGHRFPHPTNPKKYIWCVQYEERVMDCPLGTEFDAVTSICDRI